MATSATSVVRSVATSAATLVSAPTVVTTPSPTTPQPPAATTTAATGGNDGSGGSKQSLLFFVALGFGVVFTNLWIIVGVKYCFRYNRRARAAALRDENGDPIDLGNMPRPRRRREKKLMTMDEVNERFPLTKYKIWRATREREGLPVEGGVTAPPSRAASIKEAVGLARVSSEDPERPDTTAGSSTANENQPRPSASDADNRPIASDTHDFAAAAPTRASTDARKSLDITKAATQVNEQPAAEAAKDAEKTKRASTEINIANEPLTPSPEDEDDEDDPIHRAVPAELLAAPGDSCAICIDTLEDDDEVRGLTCGHAFHAGCLDPWLTSRRACCPLCKADYFVPKPRAEGEQAEEERSRRRARRNNPSTPAAVWIPSGRHGTFRPQILLSNTRFSLNDWGRGNGSRSQRQQNESNNTGEQQDDQQEQADEQTTRPSRFPNWIRNTPITPRLRLPRWGGARQEQTSTTPATEMERTPAQLEAGTRA